MFKNNKILYIVFFVLFIITLTEIVYYFFYSSGSRKGVNKSSSELSTEQINVPTAPVSVISTTESRVKEVTKLEPINLIGGLLKKEAKLMNGTLIVDNLGNSSFLGYYGDPIMIDVPFRIRMKFAGEGDESVQLVLGGRIQQVKKEWWEGIHMMYIAYNLNNNKFLIIELRDGRSEIGESLFIREIIPPDPLTLEFLDSRGKEFAIIDSEGKVLQKVNTTNLKKAKFPNGLFPDNKLWAGVLVGPRTKLSVNEFLLSPIGK